MAFFFFFLNPGFPQCINSCSIILSFVLGQTFYHGFRFLFSMIRLGNFFSCKVPDSISHNSALHLQHKSVLDSMQMSRCGSVPINLHKLICWIWLPDRAWWFLPYPIVGFWREYISLVTVSTKWYFSSLRRNTFHVHKTRVAINFLCHCLNGIVLISPPILKEIFTECRILGQLPPLPLERHCLIVF